MRMQASPWLDNLVFDSVKKGFGGRLRFIVSGGAPLARRVQVWSLLRRCYNWIEVWRLGPDLVN